MTPTAKKVPSRPDSRASIKSSVSTTESKKSPTRSESQASVCSEALKKDDTSPISVSINFIRIEKNVNFRMFDSLFREQALDARLHHSTHQRKIRHLMNRTNKFQAAGQHQRPRHVSRGHHRQCR